MRGADYETTFHFKGLWGCESKCGVQFFRKEDGSVVVILTELPDNPGTSVTNYIEHITKELTPLVDRWACECEEEFTEGARRVLRCPFHRKEIDDDEPPIVWIEHYPERGSVNRFPESFDLVTLLTPHGTAWKRLRPEELEALL